MRIIAIADELYRIAEEYGDLEGVMPDPIERGWVNLVDRVEYDPERQAVQLVSDR